MKKNIRNLIRICLSTTLLCGCSDFLSEYSQDMIVPKTINDLNELLIGEVYMPSKQQKYGMNDGSCLFFNMLDDDINTVGTNKTGNVGHPNYNYSVNGMYGYFAWQQDVRFCYQAKSHSDDSATWNDLYHRINVVNIILHEIEELPHETPDDYEKYLRVKGESYFLRGQFYFILANLYGDAYAPSTCAGKLCVPLKLTNYVEYDKTADRQFERASVKVVYDQIIADLKEAARLLTESPQQSKFRLHRATWEAASLLLSRVYLYVQDWENAEKEAAKVMKSPLFDLATINTLSEEPFLTRNNPEIIFSQGSNPIGGDVTNWSVTAKRSDHCVTRDLYDLYSDSDKRKSSFFEEVVDTDSIGLRKYQKGDINHISDALMLRMSEAYLNYAEACAMQPSKTTEANTTLNSLRHLRIEEYTDQTYNGEELVTEIRNERRKELCFEGKRWFDLRRYAVCERYPYSRDIIHVFNVYNDNLSFAATEYYRLPAGDPAYTFSLPRKVLDYDKVPLPNNPRDPREPLETEDKK